MPIKLGEHRTAWIRRNSRNRAAARPETKTAKCKSCFCFGIKSHACGCPLDSPRFSTPFKALMSKARQRGFIKLLQHINKLTAIGTATVTVATGLVARQPVHHRKRQPWRPGHCRMIECFIAVKLMRPALLFDQAERYAVTASGIIVAAMGLIDCAADVAVK